MTAQRHRLLFALAIAALLLVAALAQYQRAEASGAVSHETHTQTVAQDQPAGNNIDGQRIDIQLWTLMASGGAAALGLVLLGVRLAMGWTKPPPEQDDSHQ